jgi:uncharacterized membrane protein
MKLRTLAVVGLLVAAAFTLSSALITRDGVGAVEWVVGTVIVVGLLLVAAHKSRRVFERG